MKKIVKALRELKKIKLYEIAEKINKNKSGLANWERGITTLSESTIQKICDFLEIDIKGKKISAKNKIVYFYIHNDIDWIYLQEISKEILRITEIIAFFRVRGKSSYIMFVVLFEKDTNNYYILKFKKLEKKEITLNYLKSIFTGAVVKEEYARDELIKKIEKEELTESDISEYFYFTYCYQSRRVPVQTPDGSTSYVHEVPIGVILDDFFYYIKYETNIEKKKKHVIDLISKVMEKTEKFLTREEFEEELKRRLLKAYEIFKIQN